MNLLIAFKKSANFLSVASVFYTFAALASGVLGLLFIGNKILIHSLLGFAAVLLIFSLIGITQKNEDWEFVPSRIFLFSSSLLMIALSLLFPDVLTVVFSVRVFVTLFIVFGLSVIYKFCFKKIISKVVLKKDYDRDFEYNPRNLEDIERLLAIYYHRWLKIRYQDRVLCRVLGERKVEAGIVYEIGYIEKETSSIFLKKEAFVPVKTK